VQQHGTLRTALLLGGTVRSDRASCQSHHVMGCLAAFCFVVGRVCHTPVGRRRIVDECSMQADFHNSQSPHLSDSVRSSNVHGGAGGTLVSGPAE
jgi:hypothetical protein